MNYLEISSFIEAKKKRKIHLEEELRYVDTLTSHLKTQKPVKWYNNLYYIVKRSLSLFFAVFFLFLFVSSFTNQKLYRKLYQTNIESKILTDVNKTFGSEKSVAYSETSAVDSVRFEQVALKPVRKDIQEKISTRLFDYSLGVGRVICILAAFLLWYLARLTRKLHLKNRLISDYYDSNLTVMDVYREAILEQNFEIEFLTKAANSRL